MRFSQATFSALLFALLLGAGLPAPGYAAPTVHSSHLGDADPLTEGWTRFGTVPGTLDQGSSLVEAGPLSPDPGCAACGLDAWGLDDRSAASATSYYRRSPSQADRDTALAQGWTLRVHLRVASEADSQAGAADPLDLSVHAAFSGGLVGGFMTGKRAYRMQFGTNGDGDPIVELVSSQGQHISVAAGNTSYGLYELVFRPDLGSATLFVDGVQRISGFTGISPGLNPIVNWGTLSNTGEGRGHYHLVEWEIGLPACFDGVDDDGDGLTDFPADPGCAEAFDDSELGALACDNGLDDDGDGQTDLADPSCLGDPTNETETLPSFVFETTLRLSFPLMPNLQVEGVGVAEVKAGTGGPMSLATMAVPSGVVGNATVTITTPLFSGVASSAVVSGNAPGILRQNTLGLLTGALPLQGFLGQRSHYLGFGGLTPLWEVSIPLATGSRGIGQGPGPIVVSASWPTVTALMPFPPFTFMIPAGTTQRSLSGDAWSSGTTVCGQSTCSATLPGPPNQQSATGFAHGPLSGTTLGTVVQAGGMVQLVVPIRTECVSQAGSCGGPTTMPGSLEIRFLPEPRQAVLLSSAALALVAMGWRRRGAKAAF